MPNASSRLRGWAREIKLDVVAPWYAKLVAVLVAAYALSPIDLIPDFIPVLGYVDDLIILPLGILLAVKLIPADLLGEFRDEAARKSQRPSSRAGALAVIVIWLAVTALMLWLFWPVAAR
jgi:uncharacterized membrane protein YkvA (DUF1232 family)